MRAIHVTRKPLFGTTARNALKYGTGGLNIDGSRIGVEFRTYKGAGASPQKIVNHDKGDTGIGMLSGEGKSLTFEVQGRWPPNVVFQHAWGCECVGGEIEEKWECVGGCPVKVLEEDAPGTPRFFFQFEGK